MFKQDGFHLPDVCARIDYHCFPGGFVSKDRAVAAQYQRQEFRESSDNKIVTPGYKALQKNLAIADLSARGRIRVLGEDRARLIHALTTNHIQQMKPGQHLYAFFLTAQGRIISDAYINCYEDHLLLDVEPEQHKPLLRHIDHYIIADDVTLEDVTESTFSFEVFGSRIYGELRDRAETMSHYDAIRASPEDLRAFRIDSFRPRFGEDFFDTTLPQETGVVRALHFQKGCYLGQEIVERIRSRGHVNKMLVGLMLEKEEAFPPGTKIFLNGEEMGQITSIHSASAIAMVRIQASKPGTVIQVGDISAEVAAVS